MLKISELEQDVLNKMFSSNILPLIRLNSSEKYSDQYKQEELDIISSLTTKQFTVVGIDIYQYSLFPSEKQIFIPHLFEMVYNHSWKLIQENFCYLFQHYGKFIIADVKREYIKPRDYFISTGDGGFQILETPLHAIIYLLTFSTILRFYNSDMFMRKLYAKIGSIDVRYAVTHGDIFKFRKNYFGSAIINNARILGKDKLNRLLLDNNAYQWFLKSMAGIENLMNINLVDLSEIDEFKDYDTSKMDNANSLIVKQPEGSSLESIRSIDVQKIGRIRQKMTLLDIYNLHIQAVIEYRSLFKQSKTITISVGNLNVSGIDSE